MDPKYLSAERLDLRPGERLLIYGIGNVGRQDDGLGIRLIDALEAYGPPPGVVLEANYQLNVEDALLLTEFDVVVFVDATKDPAARAPYSLSSVRPVADSGFSSHALDAPAVLSLCEELYHHRPRAFMFAVPGYAWEINENLSDRAQENLVSASQALLKEMLCTRSP